MFRNGWALVCVGLFVCLSAGYGTAATPPQRAELENGLVLLHQGNPAALTVAVCCFIKVSALVETRDTAGLRNLTQQTLMDLPDEQGTRLQERLAQSGLVGTVQTSPDYVEAMFQGTADQLPELLHCVRIILGKTQPDPRLVNLRKAAVLRHQEERRELPLPYARDLAQAHLYASSSCAWPPVGTYSVRALLPEQLMALRRMRYVPNNTLVSISGNVTWERCRQQAHEALADLLPQPVPPEPTLRLTNRARPAVLYEPWEGDNAVLMLATPCPSPETPAFAPAMVLNAVLGSGEGSRLFRVLRDKEGLTYSILSDLTPSRICGTIGISASCEPKQAAQVLQLMQSEVAALKSRPPSEAEVQRAKAYLTSSYVLGHQRNAEVAHYLGLFELLSPKQREADLTDMVARVDPSQVQTATRWLLDQSVWVQVGGQRP